MIEIDLSLAFTLYLLLILTVFFLFWAHQEGKRKFRSLNNQKGYLWQCSICAFIYHDPKEDRLSCCPRCQSFNKRMYKGTKEKKGSRGPGAKGSSKKLQKINT